MSAATEPQKYAISELASAVDLPVRTIRFYLQKGMIAPPHGSGRGAWYDLHHLEQLIQIKRWQSAGLSLERIQTLLAQTETPALPKVQPKPGDIQVLSQLYLAEGVTLMIDPSSANLSSEQLRQLASAILETYQQVLAATNAQQSQGEQNDIREE